jgi:competence protein ComEC
LSADLIGSVGFLLSVFATAGVLVGVSVTRSRTPRWLWTPLGATIGAQIAVAPIILVVFGTIPFLAPVANLVAAPVVAGTTLAGFVAVIVPLPAIADVARFGAEVVLQISERAAGGPQLSATAAAGVGLVGVLTAFRTTRPLGMAAALIAAVVLASGAPSWPTTPSVVVLDVGQGDAILVQDPSGLAMLVDGGGNPGVLDRALRRHGVTRLDTVVVTHGDADHVGGLVGLAGSIDVGSLWIGAFNDRSVLTDKVIEDAERASVPIRGVQDGDRGGLGSIGIEVLGPQRRYLSENDGSVVLLVTAERTMLLPGDIESIGQADLPALRPDVLLIPHHGSATTSIRWLDKTVGEIAVLSYGENTYGHPHPDVLASLEGSGARVLQTFLDGDVTIPLG